jgi:hypothetical protein
MSLSHAQTVLREKMLRRDCDWARERDSKRERVQEATCPPKMRKRRKDIGSDVVDAQTHFPPRVDQGKGKARVHDESMAVSAVHVDARVVDMDAIWMQVGLWCGSLVSRLTLLHYV